MTESIELEEEKLRHGEYQLKRGEVRKVATRARALARRRERPREKSECPLGEKGSFKKSRS